MNLEFSKEELTRYLLREGSAEEWAQVSDTLPENEELDAALREIENDLIDDLARGRLGEPRSSALRRYLTETGQAERIAFARSLAHRTQKGFGLRWLAIAAALLLAAALAWRAWPVRPSAPVAAPDEVAVVLRLNGAASRGGAAMRPLTIARQTTVIDLEIETGDEAAAGYRLRLLNARGETVLSREGSPWPRPLLKLRVPADALPSGPLTVELNALSASGANPVAFFDVVVLR